MDIEVNESLLANGILLVKTAFSPPAVFEMDFAISKEDMDLISFKRTLRTIVNPRLIELGLKEISDSCWVWERYRKHC